MYFVLLLRIRIFPVDKKARDLKIGIFVWDDTIIIV